MGTQTSEFSVTENPGILLFCVGCHCTTDWVHGPLPPPPLPWHTHTEGSSWSLLVFLICQSEMPVPLGCWEDKMRLHKAQGLAIRVFWRPWVHLALWPSAELSTGPISGVWGGGLPSGTFLLSIYWPLCFPWPAVESWTTKQRRQNLQAFFFFFCNPPQPRPCNWPCWGLNGPSA